MQNKRSVFLSVLVAGVLLTACSASKTAGTSSDATSQSPDLSQKTGVTTKTGKITSLGGKYFIEVTGQQPQSIDSYKVTLSQYVNKTVTITGQFSGDTLFVGTIQ